MEITEVRIKLMEDNSGSNERLQAFCSITFDDSFVIRDLKIIEGAKGFFVAMPSRKLTDRCNHCGTKNHLRSRFCNQCGSRLDENRALRDADGRAKLHADIAPPDQLRAAARRSRARCWPPTPTSWSAPSCRATSRGTTTSTAASSTPRTPTRRPPRPWPAAPSPRCVAARFAATPSTPAPGCGPPRRRPPGAVPRGRRPPTEPGRLGRRVRLGPLSRPTREERPPSRRPLVAACPLGGGPR